MKTWTSFQMSVIRDNKCFIFIYIYLLSKTFISNSIDTVSFKCKHLNVRTYEECKIQTLKV